MCRANIIKDDSPAFKSWEMEIVEPSKPNLFDTNMDHAKESKKVGDSLKLVCNFTGIPHPKISWYKDDTQIKPENNESRIALYHDDTSLDFLYVKAEDEGHYKCEAKNRLGVVSREIKLKITGKIFLRLK